MLAPKELFIAIAPYDYSAATFWAHTGPWQQLEHKCYDDFGEFDYKNDRPEDDGTLRSV